MGRNRGRPIHPRPARTAAGLRPALPADRRSLLRRGPLRVDRSAPQTEEVEEFVEDPAPGRLRAGGRSAAGLAALRRAVGPALDGPGPLQRHAGQRGGHAVPNAWRYRDYLIRAFNADLPYDQLMSSSTSAGDSRQPRIDRPRESNESVIGTAFYWMSEGKRSPVDLAGTGRDVRQPHRRPGQDVPRPHRRVRALPRPQVRPDPPGGLLRPLRLPQELPLHPGAAEPGRGRRPAPRSGRPLRETAIGRRRREAVRRDVYLMAALRDPCG